MKIILLLGFLLLTFFSFSQPNEKMLFFNVDKDTIIFYLNDVGDITTKSTAVFYRKARLESGSFNYSGIVKDYYMNKQIAYECNYTNNNLNGSVKSYYSNGQLKYTGYFNNSYKDSIWLYYYDNGNIEKVVQFKDSIPYVKEFYKENGKNVFNNGNGNFKSVISYSYKHPLKCTISGKIVNGKIDGSWHWKSNYCSGIDYFNDGKYIRSEDFGIKFSPLPQAVSLLGFDLHENVDVFKFIALPQEKNKSNMVLNGVPLVFKNTDIVTSFSLNSSNPINQPLKYKGSSSLNKEFSNELTNLISGLITQNQINDFWCFIQFTVTSDSNLENIHISSNNNIIDQSINKYLTDINEFEAARMNNGVVDCNVYLNLYFENDKLYIPEYYYDGLMINRLK